MNLGLGRRVTPLPPLPKNQGKEKEKKRTPGGGGEESCYLPKPRPPPFSFCAFSTCFISYFYIFIFFYVLFWIFCFIFWVREGGILFFSDLSIFLILITFRIVNFSYLLILLFFVFS